MIKNGITKQVRLTKTNRVIHHIDSALDFIGMYILTPQMVISISISIVSCLGILIFAHYSLDYQSSGNELIVAFITGIAIGIIAKYISKLAS